MIIDSGTSEHVISGVGLFETIGDVDKGEVELSDRSTVPSKYKGKVLVHTERMTLKMITIFLILKVQLYLQSCSRFDEHGIVTVM